MNTILVAIITIVPGVGGLILGVVSLFRNARQAAQRDRITASEIGLEYLKASLADQRTEINRLNGRIGELVGQVRELTRQLDETLRQLQVARMKLREVGLE